MLTRENGKTLAEAAGEVGVAATLRHSAAQSLTEAGSAAEVAPGQYFSSLAEPVGVVAIIVPWNAPVALFIRSLGPALAAGNTVVAKLPAQTALTNALIADIVSQATSLPRGRRQHVHRVGPTLERRSLSNPLMSTWSASRAASRSAGRSPPPEPRR